MRRAGYVANRAKIDAAFAVRAESKHSFSFGRAGNVGSNVVIKSGVIDYSSGDFVGADDFESSVFQRSLNDRYADIFLLRFGSP